VVNLDISKRYLEWGQANYRLNGLRPVKTDFIFGDVFDWLRRFGRGGQRFDMVIVDPPSYATTRQTRFTVERDYAALAALAAQVTAPGGTLLACANSRALGERAFRAQLARGLAGRAFSMAAMRHEPDVDFPRPAREEGYLKVIEVRLTAGGREQPAARHQPEDWS
jgi:23S rRNA (cytosine1962-C5)-methyltransferase